jgi:hypothetical protein
VLAVIFSVEFKNSANGTRAVTSRFDGELVHSRCYLVNEANESNPRDTLGELLNPNENHLTLIIVMIKPYFRSVQNHYSDTFTRRDADSAKPVSSLLKIDVCILYTASIITRGGYAHVGVTGLRCWRKVTWVVRMERAAWESG